MINNPNNRQAIAANIMKCFGQDVDIIKGGEGSRGGKITGYNKSGKPIYESSHSIDSNGNVVNNNPEQQAINEKFKHHRLMTAYHAGKAFEHHAKGDKENVKIHSEEGQKHVQEAKRLHNKKEHGGWMDSIPDNKDAQEYGKKHYKG